jgi:hypothetical protein
MRHTKAEIMSAAALLFCAYFGVVKLMCYYFDENTGIYIVSAFIWLFFILLMRRSPQQS